MGAPLVVIGAGFNADAAAEAGPTALSCEYPLVDRLKEICFGPGPLPAGRSVEHLFDEALASRQRKPLAALCETLMRADFYLGESLAVRDSPNSYRTFLERFAESHFLTFNYDALIEILLFALKRWCPKDGYGVAVEAPLDAEPADLPLRSQSLVLHLHGALYVYPSEFTVSWTETHRSHTGLLKPRATPEFRFDPDASSLLFSPYRRVSPDHSYRYPDQRIIAPVPDKAEGLRATFIRAVHLRAIELASRTTRVVSIGYSFNPYDRASYDRLLQTLASRKARVVLVTPDANAIARRLKENYPLIEWIAKPLTFREWVSRGFPGVEV